MKSEFSIPGTLVLAALSCLPTFGDPVKGPVDLGDWQRPGASRGWQLSDPQDVAFVRPEGQPAYLHVVSPAPYRADESAQCAVPAAKVRGTFVAVRVDVRAQGVTQPAQSYNGIKVMLHVVRADGGQTWDQADAEGPSFPVNYDWTPKTFQTMIPPEAVSVTLVLGLQQSAGTVDFRHLQMTVIGTPATAPVRAASGPVYTGHGPGALRGVMTSPDIQPADVAVLKTWRVNVIRWQILRPAGTPTPPGEADLAGYDAWLDENLRRLDAMLPVFGAAGIRVVVDMHDPPGGRGPDGTVRLFGDPVLQQHLIACWDRIARRYRGSRAVWGYDLMNEPVVDRAAPGVRDWHDLAETLARRVRRIDRTHALIVEPDPWASVDALRFFAPLPVPGVVYSIHFYDPHAFTHQGVEAGQPIGQVYPGTIDGVAWDADHIRGLLAPAAAYAKSFHVAIYLGEFSAVRWAPGAAQYIRDVIRVAEDDHWDWTYHAFREWQGWSPEVGPDPNDTGVAATPTDRLRVLQAAWARNGERPPVRPAAQRKTP